jgi:hypothetical protein
LVDDEKLVAATGSVNPSGRCPTTGVAGTRKRGNNSYEIGQSERNRQRRIPKPFMNLPAGDGVEADMSGERGSKQTVGSATRYHHDIAKRRVI